MISNSQEIVSDLLINSPVIYSFIDSFKILMMLCSDFQLIPDHDKKKVNIHEWKY